LSANTPNKPKPDAHQPSGSDSPRRPAKRFDLGKALSRSLKPCNVDELKQKSLGRVRLLKADDLQGQIRDAIEDALRGPRRELIDSRERATQLAATLEKMETELDEATKRAKIEAKAHSETRRRLQEVQAALQETEEDNERLAAEIASLSQRLEASKSANRELLGAFEQACTESERFETEQGELETQVETLVRDLEATRRRASVAEKEVGEVRARLCGALVEEAKARGELRSSETQVELPEIDDAVIALPLVERVENTVRSVIAEQVQLTAPDLEQIKLEIAAELEQESLARAGAGLAEPKPFDLDPSEISTAFGGDADLFMLDESDLDQVTCVAEADPELEPASVLAAGIPTVDTAAPTETNLTIPTKTVTPVAPVAIVPGPEPTPTPKAEETPRKPRERNAIEASGLPSFENLFCARPREQTGASQRTDRARTPKHVTKVYAERSKSVTPRRRDRRSPAERAAARSLGSGAVFFRMSRNSDGGTPPAS
jgi:hypothetical protein